MSKVKETLDKKKEALKRSADNALTWMIENPLKTGLILGIGSNLIKGAVGATKRRKIEKIDAAKRLTIYDPTMDCRWQLRREMTNDELRTFSSLLDSGMSRGDALEKMKLLK